MMIFVFIRNNFLSYIRQKYTKSYASFFCYILRTQHGHSDILSLNVYTPFFSKQFGKNKVTIQ